MRAMDRRTFLVRSSLVCGAVLPVDGGVTAA
jgi:hypothetical protein